MSAERLHELLAQLSDLDDPALKLDYHNALVSELKFTYFVDKALFSQFLVSKGVLSEMAGLSVAPDSKPQKDRIQKLEDWPNLKSREFDFLSYSVDPDWDESEIQCVNKDMNDFLLTQMKDYTEIKRVIYKAIDGKKIERELLKLKVIFASNSDVKNKRWADIAKTAKTIQISRFMGGHDLARFLFFFSSSLNPNIRFDYPGNEYLALAEKSEPTEENIEELFTKKTDLKFIDLKDSLPATSLYNGRLLVCFYKTKHESWCIDLDKPIPEIYECFVCKDKIENPSYFDPCGRIYCSYSCNNKDTHDCKPKKCNYCYATLRTADFVSMCLRCKCLYCGSSCLRKDGHSEKSVCSPNPLSNGGNLANLPDNKGAVGLSNVGNTCYMNSALQCMLHNPFLKDMLMDQNILNEVNLKNPLGTKGELLKETKDLYMFYWKTGSSSISPWGFKSVMCKYLPTFEGFAQHDSQEFLSQMLDTLHEDTNRILTKPYTTPLEGKAKDENSEIARKCWVNFLKRNYSKIIENFYGQFRSLVQCEKCKNDSLSFDPFQIVSLSIPAFLSETFTVFYVESDQMTRAKHYTFTASSSKNFTDIPTKAIMTAFSEKVGVPIEKLKMGVVGFGYIGEIFDENATVSKVYETAQANEATKNLTFIFHLNELDQQYIKSPNSLLVMFRTTEESTWSFSLSKKKDSSDPLYTKFFYLTTNHLVADLYINILRKLYSAIDPDNISAFKNESKFDTAFYTKVWNWIKENPKLQFFSIKVNGNTLGPTDNVKTLGELLNPGETRLILQVVVRKDSKLSLDLEKFLKYNKEGKIGDEFTSQTKKVNQKLDLLTLLDHFAKTELLEGDNRWKCSNCKTEVVATKTMQIYKAPENLIIHLKRVKGRSESPEIDFPIKELDLSPYVLDKTPTQAYNVRPEEFMEEKDRQYYKEKGINPKFDFKPTPGLKYKLVGIVNHSGSQHFGHYTSNHLVGDKWYEFNDSAVYSCSESTLVSSHAYILFYEKIKA